MRKLFPVRVIGDSGRGRCLAPGARTAGASTRCGAQSGQRQEAAGENAVQANRMATGLLSQSHSDESRHILSRQIRASRKYRSAWPENTTRERVRPTKLESVRAAWARWNTCTQRTPNARRVCRAVRRRSTRGATLACGPRAACRPAASARLLWRGSVPTVSTACSAISVVSPTSVVATSIRRTSGKGRSATSRCSCRMATTDLDTPAGNWWLANQQLAAALEFRGYDVHLARGTGGHDGQHGGAILPDSLRWLWS
jgi:hypothetical protein